MQVPLSGDEGTCCFSLKEEEIGSFRHVCTNAANHKREADYRTREEPRKDNQGSCNARYTEETCLTQGEEKERDYQMVVL